MEKVTRRRRAPTIWDVLVRLVAAGVSAELARARTPEAESPAVTEAEDLYEDVDGVWKPKRRLPP